MSHHHHNHCNIHGCHHHHHEGEEKSEHCCCCSGCCKCCQKKCECSCSCCKGDFSKQLLKMADDAWMEVLKEKLMDQIRASSSKDLDKLAKLVSETNKVRWKNKLVSKTRKDDFHDQIEQFFRKD